MSQVAFVNLAPFLIIRLVKHTAVVPLFTAVARTAESSDLTWDCHSQTRKQIFEVVTVPEFVYLDWRVFLKEERRDLTVKIISIV